MREEDEDMGRRGGKGREGEGRRDEERGGERSREEERGGEMRRDEEIET